MPKPTKFVVHFDDGTTYDIPADGTGAIFVNEEQAKKCKRMPPYKPAPKEETAGTDALATTSSTETSDTTATTMEGTCFIINGVVVCP